MKITLKEIYTFFFVLGIFFIPFNSFEGIKQLGEFKKESPSYFFLLGFLVLCIEMVFKNKVVIPYRNQIFLLMSVFFGWCILSTLFNFPFVLDSYYKRTSGVSRFIRQFFSLSVSAIFFFMLYWNVLKDLSSQEVLIKIRKVLLCSFIVVSIYGFLEVLFNNFGVFPAYLLLRIFDYFPFTEYDYDINKRISSVCFEAPALATYLITVSGWMLSYILTHKSYFKYIPALVVILLTYFSGSRTALVVVLLQFVLFFSLILTRNQKILAGVGLFTSILIITGMIFFTKADKIIYDVEKKIESLDFRGNLKSNISNQSRFGIQYANLVVFTENPIVGVGYGQQGYHAINHYPIWAKKNNYEFQAMYLNKTNPMFPPGYNLYIRLLAETGIIGLSIFLMFLFYLVSKTRKIIREQYNTYDKTLGIIILVSFLGFSMNWLQLDTFRMYGFWLSVVILIKISYKSNNYFKKGENIYESVS